jgi:hypothetical protein
MSPPLLALGAVPNEQPVHGMVATQAAQIGANETRASLFFSPTTTIQIYRNCSSCAMEAIIWPSRS